MDVEKKVSDIMSKINRAEQDIAAKRELWLEFYKMYRSYRSEDTVSGRSSASIPAAFEWVEVVKSRLFDIFFGKRPYVRVRGREASDDMSAKVRQEFMNYQFDHANIKKLGYDALTQMLTYGTTIIKPYWKFQEKERTINVPIFPEMPALGSVPQKKMVPVYDDICIDLVDIFDFRIDPEAMDIDDAEWCAQRTLRTTGYIKEMASYGRYKNIRELLSEVDSQGDTPEKDIHKQQRNVIEGHQSSKSNMLRPIELWEYWTNDRVTTIANGKYIIRDESNPYFHGKKPFIAGKIISVPHEFYGISLIEAGAQAAKIMEDLLNNGLDNVNFSINSMIAVDQTRVEDTELISRPGGIIHTTGEPQRAIYPLTVNDITPNLFNFFQMASEIAKRSTGLTDYVVGQATSGKTATEASLLTNEAAKRIGLHLEMFGLTFMGPLCEMIDELNKQFVTGGKTVRVTGMGYDPYQVIEVTPDVFGSEVDFIWESEDRELNNMTARQELIQALTIANANPILAGYVPMIFAKILDTYDMHENDALKKALDLANAMVPLAQETLLMGGGAVGGNPNVQKVGGEGGASDRSQSLNRKGSPTFGSMVNVR